MGAVDRDEARQHPVRHELVERVNQDGDGARATTRFFFFKQKTAYEIGLGIPAEPLFRSVDPNFGRRVRNRRQLNSLQNTWPYGYSMPIAVRYTQDAFSRSGWLWPVDAKGEPLKATSYMAVGFYVAKYVNKKS